MKKVFFSSCGGLYLIGKVRKNYKVGDVLRLKNFLSKVEVIQINRWNGLIVKIKKEA